MSQVRYFGLALLLLLFMADDPSCANIQSFLPNLPKLSDAKTPGEKKAAEISDDANSALSAANLEDLALITHDPAQLDQAQEAYRARARKNHDDTTGIPRYDYEKHALFVAKGDYNAATASIVEGDQKLKASRNFNGTETFNVISYWQLVWSLREVRDSYQSNKSSTEYKNLNFAYCEQLKKYKDAIDKLGASRIANTQEELPGYYINKSYFPTSGC